MGQVPDLIGAQGATAAGVLRPAEHPGLEEGAIDDQLPAALEQVEQAHLTLGPVELVLLLHRHPRHPSTLGGQRITRTSQGFLLHEELLARGLPLLPRHDRRYVHSEMSFVVLHVFRLVPVHVSLLLLFILALPATLYLSDRSRTLWLHGCSVNGRCIPPSCVIPAARAPFLSAGTAKAALANESAEMDVPSQ